MKKEIHTQKVLILEKIGSEENIDKLKVPAYGGKGEVLTHIT